MWGQSDLALLPAFFTDDVSLYYGSSSLMKTTGALGGCISLTNRPSWNSGFTASLLQATGSFGLLQTQLKTGWGNERWSVKTRLYLDKAKNDFRYYNDANGTFAYEKQNNADYFKDGFLQEVYYKLKTNQFLGFKTMAIWSNRNLPPLMNFQGAGRNENQTDRNLVFLGEWKKYTPKSSLLVQSGIIMNRLSYLLSNDTPYGLLVHYDTNSQSVTYSSEISFQQGFGDKIILKANLANDYTSANYSNRIDSTGYSKNRMESKMQISLHYAISRIVKAYALVNQMQVNGQLIPLMPSLGAEFELLPSQLTLKTNVGRNFHTPTLNDMYFVPGGNTDLKPEQGIQEDASLCYKINSNSWMYELELTGFSAQIQNWILWHPSEYRYWRADNVLHVLSRGAEFEIGVQKTLNLCSFKWTGNYAYTKTTNQDKTSPAYRMQLIYIPLHTGNSHWIVNYKTFSGSFSLHYTGTRSTSTNSDLLEHKLPSYTLFDVGLWKKFRVEGNSLDFSFSVNNIFDKQYQALLWRAMPGRNFIVTVRYNFSR